MINIIIEIDGKEFSPKQGSTYENLRKDKELDDMGAIITNISEEDLELLDTDKVLILKLPNITRTYIISDIKIDLISRALKSYEVEIKGIEYTKKLQDDIVIGKSFKQPNDDSLIRYKSKDVINQLLFISNLWKSENEYEIDTRTKDILDTRSPNFTFKNRTLYEALDEVLDSIDSVPRLELVNGKDKLIADELNSKNRDLQTLDNFRNILKKKNTTNGYNAIYTSAENVFDTTNKGVIHYPSEDGFVSIRTTNAVLEYDNNLYIPTEKQVEELIEVNVAYTSIPSFRVTVNTTTVTVTPESTREKFLERGINIDDLLISCIGNTVEKQVYDVLDGERGIVWKGTNRINSLYYEQGKPGIRGFSFKEKELLFDDSTDTLRNYVATSVQKDEFVYKTILDSIYGDDLIHPQFITSFTIYDGNPEGLESDSIGNFKWNVQFRSTEDITTINTKTLYDANEEIKRIKIINQKGRTLDNLKLSQKNNSLIERFDVEETLKEVIHGDINDVFELGDYIGDSTITLASYLYNTRSVQANYELDKLWNKLALRTDLDSEIRTANIDRDAVVDTPKIVRYNIILEEFTDDIASENNEVSQKFLDEYLSDGQSNKVITMEMVAQRTGVDFDGNQKYSPISAFPSTDTNGIGKAQGYVATKPYINGRNIVISGKWNDKIEITKQLNDDNTIKPRYHSYFQTSIDPDSVNYRATDPRYEGEFELATATIGYDAVELDFKKAPYNSSFIGNQIIPKLISSIRILVADYPFYKDRDENVNFQVELELKSNNENVIIFPAFNKSHRIFEPQFVGSYKAYRLLSPGTISNTTQESLDYDKSITDYQMFIRFEGSDIKVRNFGEPFAIVNDITKEVLYINNSPLDTDTFTDIRYKVKKNSRH